MTKRTATTSTASHQQQPGRLTRQQAKATGVTVATSFATPPDKRTRRRVAPAKKKEEVTGECARLYHYHPKTNPQALPSPLESSGGEVSEAASEAGAGILSNLSSDQLIALVLELQTDKEQLAAELQLQRQISAQKTAELEEAQKKLSEMSQAQEPEVLETQQAEGPTPPQRSLVSRIFGPLTSVLSPLTTRKRPIEALTTASEPVTRTIDLGASATRPYKRLRLQTPPTAQTTSQPEPLFEPPKITNRPLARAEDVDMSNNQTALTKVPAETPPSPEILLDTLFAPHKLPESIRGIRIDRSTGKLINSMMPLRRRRIRDEMERQYAQWDQRCQEHLQTEDERVRAVREATQIAHNLVLAKWPDSNVNKIREENCIYRKPGSFNATIPKAFDNSRAPEHLRPQLPDMPQPRSIKALEHPELKTPTPKKIPTPKIPTPETPTPTGPSQEAKRSPGRTFAFPYEDLDESSLLSVKAMEEERRRSVGRTFRCPSSPLSSPTDDEREPVDTTMHDVSMITPSAVRTITSPTPVESRETQVPNTLHVDHPAVTDEALRLKQRSIVLRAEYEEFMTQRQRDRDAEGIVANTADEWNRLLLLDNNAWADLMDIRRRERLEREQQKKDTEFHPWGNADVIAQQKKKERLAQEKVKDQKSSDEELARLFELAKKREKASLYEEESLDPSPATGSGPWRFGQTDSSSQAEAQHSTGPKQLPSFNPMTGTGPWLFSGPGLHTTANHIVDVYSMAPTKNQAEMDQRPPQGKQLEGFQPEQQAQSNSVTSTTLTSVRSDVSLQAPIQTQMLHQQPYEGQQPKVSQPEQHDRHDLATPPAMASTGPWLFGQTQARTTAETSSQQQTLAEPDSTIPPPSPTPKHAQLPVQSSPPMDEATHTADWQKTQLERKMRDLDRYKPKAASRLRNVSRLSSSPALAHASPKHNFEAYDEDSERFRTSIGPTNNLILQQPVGEISGGAEGLISEEVTQEDLSSQIQAYEEFITPLNYENLTPEQEDEVRLNIYNQGRENDNFIRNAHGGEEAFRQWSNTLFPSSLLQRAGPALCTPEEQREVDEFIKQQHDANPSFIKDAYGGREGFRAFANTLFPGTLGALTTTN